MYTLTIMYMNRQYGFHIGNTLGEVDDVEVDTDNIGWGPYLRLKVLLNLKKSSGKRQIPRDVW